MTRAFGECALTLGLIAACVLFVMWPNFVAWLRSVRDDALYGRS